MAKTRGNRNTKGKKKMRRNTRRRYRMRRGGGTNDASLSQKMLDYVQDPAYHQPSAH
jgi:hypothetical protein